MTSIRWPASGLQVACKLGAPLDHDPGALGPIRIGYMA